jgi:cytochrome P450
MGLFRVTKEAVEIADQKVPAGSHVQILWASANHDDSVFPDPEKLDLRRPNIRQHLSFGSGPHFCPGAPLSRFEARVTLELLVPRLRSIRLSDSFEPNWGPHFHLRGLTELPLELEVEA